MITLFSTPAYVEQASPEILCRWLATESPNNFRLLRHDWDIVSADPYNGGLLLQLTVAGYTGTEGHQITVYNRTLDAMYSGVVQAESTDTIIYTNIKFILGFDPSDPLLDPDLDPDKDYAYFNDNMLRAGYYFEGKMTINEVEHPLTIIASPDSFGYADLDVSGILRIITTLGKVGDYTKLIMAETNKSGNFSLEYRECWYGWSGAWIAAEGSPPVLWYYGEAIRSEEQGSNLHEYEADELNDAPFFNSFDRPVYFRGLPFDLTFILPERPLISPVGELTVTIRTYNSVNRILSEDPILVIADYLEGHLCSLTIDPAGIEEDAVYFTAEITAP